MRPLVRRRANGVVPEGYGFDWAGRAAVGEGLARNCAWRSIAARETFSAAHTLGCGAGVAAVCVTVAFIWAGAVVRRQAPKPPPHTKQINQSNNFR